MAVARGCRILFYFILFYFHFYRCLCIYMLRLLWSWLVIGLLFLTLLLRGYIVYANSFWFSSLNWSSKSIKHHAWVTQCLWFLFNENLKTSITLLFIILKWDEAFLFFLIWQSTINLSQNGRRHYSWLVLLASVWYVYFPFSKCFSIKLFLWKVSVRV